MAFDAEMRRKSLALIRSVTALPDWRACAFAVGCAVTVLAPSAAGQAPSASCAAPAVQITSIADGMMRVLVDSACRARQSLVVKYDTIAWLAEFDPSGKTEIVIDAFAGGQPITLAFEDKSRVERQLPAQGFDNITKVAVVWSAPVELDLHAIEYGAPSFAEVHRWSQSPGSHAQAQQRVEQTGRSHGFISTSSTGREIARRHEVYTILHAATPVPGVIRFSVDFASRGNRADGEFCGDGPNAKVDFEVYVLDRGRALRRYDREIGALPCGTDLRPQTRYVTRLIPDIVIGNRD